MERTEIQRLFMQHYAKMYRVARSILYDEQESEDVVSDIFESLLHGQMVLLSDTEENYLLTSVRNRCFKRMRHEDVKLQMKEQVAVEQTVDADSDDERLTDIDGFENNGVGECDHFLRPLYGFLWQGNPSMLRTPYCFMRFSCSWRARALVVFSVYSFRVKIRNKKEKWKKQRDHFFLFANISESQIVLSRLSNLFVVIDLNLMTNLLFHGVPINQLEHIRHWLWIRICKIRHT